MKRIILTGTPGCGKTSILRSLEMRGHFVVEEAATDVIAFDQANGIAEPWKNPVFIDNIIRLQRHRQIQVDDIPVALQYFDRSPFCTYALSVYLGYEPSEILMAEIDRVLQSQIYERQVFFVENLGFCTPSEARKISYEEALMFETIHKETYDKFGFDCVMIPPGALDERVERCISISQQAVDQLQRRN
jgi:predicted ATPase